jgi:DNA repair protein RecO (recombination protein O)
MSRYFNQNSINLKEKIRKLMSRTEGVILQTINFQDYDQILSIFSPDLGIEKIFVKNSYRLLRKERAPSLLTQCEFIYRQGKSSFLTCDEFSILNYYLRLRKDFATLQAACDLLRLIQRSQLPGKPAPLLYKLLLKYLEGLDTLPDPRLVVASFRLKLMRHEGVLNLTNFCQTCQKTLSSFYFSRGECFCSTHSPRDAFLFSSQETALLQLLAYCRSLKELIPLSFSSDLEKKIDRSIEF